MITVPTVSVPEVAGHVNNKKGITSTKDATYGTATYILATRNCSTGSQVFIQAASGNFEKTRNFIPEIPYRVYFNSSEPIADMNSYLKLDDKFALFKMFNPGVSGVAGSINIPGWNSNTNRFIELNFTRSMIEFMFLNSSSKSGAMYFSFFDGYNTPNIHTNTRIRLTDYQASIIVKKDTSDPDLYDNLYLTLCTRIDIFTEEPIIFSRTFSSESKQFSYALPITLKYRISKADIDSSSMIDKVITPVSWTFPISINWTNSNSPNQIGKINSGLSTTYQNQMWNYNLIPSYLSTNKIVPVNNGCLADHAYFSDNKHMIYSTIGNHNKSKNINEQYSAVCFVDFDSTGFCLPYNWNVDLLDASSRIQTISVQNVDDAYLAVAKNIKKVDGSFGSYINFYPSSTGLSASKYIDNAELIDIQIINGYLYIQFYLGKLYVYKFPVIDNSYITSFGMFNVMEPISFFNSKCTIKSAIDNVTVGEVGLLRSQDKSLGLYKDLAETFKGKFLYLNYSSIDNLIIERIWQNGIQDTYKFSKNINAGISADLSIGIIDRLITYDEDGFGIEEYIEIGLSRNAITNSTKAILVNKYNPASFELSNGILTIDYAKKDIIGTENSNNVDTNGIVLNFKITNCSGIYSKYPLTISAFDSTLPTYNSTLTGGIEIDSDTRPDITFKYIGDSNVFDPITSGGYMAKSDSDIVTISCTTVDGKNLLSDPNKTKYPLLVSEYGDAGLFTMNLVLNLDLDDVGSTVTYDDPAFILEDCKLKVSVYNALVSSLESEEYTFNIDFPLGSGMIFSEDHITKFVDSAKFYITRDADFIGENYTELHEVYKKSFDIWNNSKEGKITSSGPTDYKNENPKLSYDNSKEVSFNADVLSRGSYMYYRYEPLLNGDKHILPDESGYSELVTNCLGHRYYISDVELRFSDDGVFGDDVLDEISSSDPYVYVSTSGAAEIKVNLNINHEDWTCSNTENLRDIIYKDNPEKVYPLISGVYLIAEKYNYSSKFLQSDPFNPYDDATTYPNFKGVELTKTLWKLGYETSSVYPTGILYTPVDPQKSQEIKVTIKDAGKYRVYLAVEDEFGQFSSWCITNKENSFNLPV